MSTIVFKMYLYKIFQSIFCFKHTQVYFLSRKYKRSSLQKKEVKLDQHNHSSFLQYSHRNIEKQTADGDSEIHHFSLASLPNSSRHITGSWKATYLLYSKSDIVSNDLSKPNFIILWALPYYFFHFPILQKQFENYI